MIESMQEFKLEGGLKVTEDLLAKFMRMIKHLCNKEDYQFKTLLKYLVLLLDVISMDSDNDEDSVNEFVGSSLSFLYKAWNDKKSD